MLKEDTVAFEEFLKANDGSSANAAKMLDSVTVNVCFDFGATKKCIYEC